MTYKKPIKCMVQVVMGVYDEDGELVGEEYDPTLTAIYHPFSSSLDKLLHEREKQEQRQERPLPGLPR